jgi:hypothetical protein
LSEKFGCLVNKVPVVSSRTLSGVLALSSLLVFVAPGQAALFISEVAPWSSGSSPVAADWFEVTNTGSSALNISGWKMDDNSNSFGSAVALNGITSIASGESVIFIETTSPATTISTFRNIWFGTNPPANLQIGSYSGSGVGLGTGGDAVNLFNALGVVQARVDFGASPTAPFRTFDNAAGLNNVVISTLSTVGVNGAFVAVNDPNEIGSPGSIAAVPEPSGILGLLGLGVMGGSVFALRRHRSFAKSAST